MQKQEDFLLIFLHGFLGDLHDWVDVINNSDLTKFECLAIDLPGHGKFPCMNDKDIYTEEFLLNYYILLLTPFAIKK